MKYSVYKHTFPNGKIYIGITSRDPEIRWNHGYGYLTKSNGKYSQPLMAHAILKYNWDDIQHEVLFSNLTEDEASQYEIELIKKYKSNDKNFGYNISSGGATGNFGVIKDYTGQKYNMLTFIERTDIICANSSYKWKLKCDCGNYIIRKPSYVINGNIKSCGCLTKENMNKTLDSYIGRVSGKLKCIDVDKNNDTIKAICECGNVVVFGRHDWQHYNRKSCGCLKKETSIKHIKLAQAGITDDIILNRNKTIKSSLRTNSNVKPFICIETNKIYNTGYEVNDDFKKNVYPNIIKALKGEIKSAYGLHWKYVN